MPKKLLVTSMISIGLVSVIMFVLSSDEPTRFAEQLMSWPNLPASGDPTVFP